MSLDQISQVFGAGAYSPCMQGMHCMPSHLAQKDNNNTSTSKNLKQNQGKLPELQVFTFKSN